LLFFIILLLSRYFNSILIKIMKKITLLALLMLSLTAFSQSTPKTGELLNAAQKMAADEDRLTIGGYAQIDFNQPLESGRLKNGNFDVHRLVLLFGYKFNQKIQFITEIELEHVSEVYVEQAFLEYKVRDWLKFRGGLMLIPMGIINEYHEPPSFNGVERPSLDTYIVPTTWRELGVGITGVIREAGLKYQLYLFNGPISNDGGPRFNGKNAIRGGRQKGMEALSLTPNVAGKIEYYGVKGLNLGLSGYAGRSQSELFGNVPKEGPERLAADSSVTGIAIFGLDARYNIKGAMLRGQVNFGRFTNSEAYNAFTGSDLGSAMNGFYLEAGYNVFSSFEKIKSELIPFIRYENYNTQSATEGGLAQDPTYHRKEFTAGIGWKPVSGVAVKADYQLFNTEVSAKGSSRLNLGIGVWF
jgi:hypothetical protein